MMWKSVMLLCFVLFLAACAGESGADQNNQAVPQAGADNGSAQDDTSSEKPLKEVPPEETAAKIVTLLKNKDLPRLAAYIHPTNGVRFTPYGHVNPDTDIVMTAPELQDAFTNESSVIWGSYDGSGEPIALSFKDYYDRFIYDKDYLSAQEIGFNKTIGQGNSVNNAKDVYPNSYIIEYHIPGTEEYGGMDWSSLRIVLEQYEQEWLCTAIIHDQWTI